jgi:hypothetical protein
MELNGLVLVEINKNKALNSAIRGFMPIMDISLRRL